MKFISENNFFRLDNKIFFQVICAIIFLISIYIRSINDIGPDTGIYILVAQKIANGGKYYYDFFESNFPLSFYFYLIQFKISQITSIHPVILSEVVINILAILSILWSSQILKKTNLFHNKSHYHLMIICFFFAFFLRVPGIKIYEFGTKTSLAMILLIPYLSYCLMIYEKLTNLEKIKKGILMGLLPCIKPHYIFFVIGAELVLMLKLRSLKKQINFCFDNDKKIALTIIALYLLLMVKFTPEFFKFIIPMWSEFYHSYSNHKIFYEMTLKLISYSFIMYFFIIIAKIKTKNDENDTILLTFFFSAILVAITENANTIDQASLNFCFILIITSKIIYDALKQKVITFNVAIIYLLPAIIILSLIENNSFGGLFYSHFGLINAFWPYLIWKIYKDQKLTNSIKLRIISLAILLFFSIISINLIHYKSYIAINSLAILGFIYFFEKKINISPKLSLGSSLIFTLSTVYFIGFIISFNFKSIIYNENHYKYAKNIHYYSKINADKKFNFQNFDKISNSKFPTVNYLGIYDESKFYLNYLPIDSSKIFENTEMSYVEQYLFNNTIKMIKKPYNKLIIMNDLKVNYSSMNECKINILERFLRNNQFRKIFIKNYKFDNMISFYKNKSHSYNNFEFYVRKN